MSDSVSQVEAASLWARILAAGAKVWHLIHAGAAEIVKVNADHPEILKEAHALLSDAEDKDIDVALEIANVVNGISDQGAKPNA